MKLHSHSLDVVEENWDPPSTPLISIDAHLKHNDAKGSNHQLIVDIGDARRLVVINWCGRRFPLQFGLEVVPLAACGHGRRSFARCSGAGSGNRSWGSRANARERRGSLDRGRRGGEGLRSLRLGGSSSRGRWVGAVTVILRVGDGKVSLFDLVLLLGGERYVWIVWSSVLFSVLSLDFL